MLASAKNYFISYMPYCLANDRNHVNKKKIVQSIPYLYYPLKQDYSTLVAYSLILDILYASVAYFWRIKY